VSAEYRSAAAWAAGPDRLYRALAVAAVALLPDVSGRLVLDAGAGTGAAGAVLRERGARVVAVDGSADMLGYGRPGRPDLPAVGDVTALPLRDGCLDGAVAAFVVNHLDDPSAALVELGRVCVGGATVLATTFPTKAVPHPVKGVVDDVLAGHGFQAPTWHADLHDVAALTGTTALFATRATDAGLCDVRVERIEVDLTPLGVAALTAYRLGMAHAAPWVAGLDRAARDALAADAMAAVGALDPIPPMPILVLRATARSA
jgi:hypothetical protein